MESFATPYPVLFSDGDKKYDKGHVGVYAVLSYRRFQTSVAQVTGIPPNQQSTVFVCRRTLKTTEKRQRLPINENTNFGIILNQHNPSREKDCYFLVSIKKSKRDRKGRGKRNVEVEVPEEYESGSSRDDISPSDEWPGFNEQGKSAKPKKGGQGFRGKPEKTILRRDSSAATNGRMRFPALAARKSEAVGLNVPLFENGGFVTEEEWRRQNQLRWFQEESGLEAGRYAAGAKIPKYYPQLAAAAGEGLYAGNGIMGFYDGSDFPSVVSPNPAVFRSLNSLQRAEAAYLKAAFANELPDVLQGASAAHGPMAAMAGATLGSTVCEQCWLSRGRPVPFHCCVYDEVTAGFGGPSPAGPIERPVKAAA